MATSDVRLSILVADNFRIDAGARRNDARSGQLPFGILLPQLESEQTITRKILSSLPLEKGGYRTPPKGKAVSFWQRLARIAVVVVIVAVAVAVGAGSAHEHETARTLQAGNNRCDDTRCEIDCAHERTTIGRGVCNTGREGFLRELVDRVEVLVREQDVTFCRGGEGRVVNLDWGGPAGRGIAERQTQHLLRI
jgi:hypothetical protein